MTRDLLLEIGTEEIPARFMTPSLVELKKHAEGVFRNERIGFSEVSVYGTPRRLTLYVSDLEERQADLDTEVKGPPYEIAFKDGTPTKAAEGFARSQGVGVSALTSKEVDGRKYVFAAQTEAGKTTAEVLPDVLPRIIADLSFPKPMRWGDLQLRFVRPIRWLVSLYGPEVIQFEFGGVVAGRRSRGHRVLAGGEIEISAPQAYLGELERSFVIADQERRKELVWAQVQEAAASAGGHVREDAGLLEEITYLVEYPCALCGGFSEKYLELPEEVLVTSMREHQRYFPVYNSENRMLPKFVAVRNGTDAFLDTVREGNENVLRARLADAEFFYREDRKSTLSSKVHQLRDVVFQQNLGSVYEKCLRLQGLVTFLADKLDWGRETREDVRRAAYLAKADLVTNMVIEFPELQGIMGCYYALHDVEREPVCVAIGEQYLPRFAGDILPATDAGCLLSIADKMDNIMGCFCVGIQPTGSQDPYALRRQALGICSTLVKFDLDLSLKDVFKWSYDLYQEGQKVKTAFEDVEDALTEFFRHRVAAILEERGIAYDVVNAVLAAGWDNLKNTVKRAEALALLRKKGGTDYNALVTGYTRAANLAQKAKSPEVNPALFQEDVERKLYEALLSVSFKVEELAAADAYVEAFRETAGLRKPIDTFFEEVMVMVEDTALRDNRTALLKSVTEFMASLADLSQIVVADS